MSWYKTGTVAVTNGSKNVVLTGGDALANIYIDDGFVGPDGSVYSVETVGGAGAFVLGENYRGATVAADGEYVIIPAGVHIVLREALTQLNTLIANYQDIAANEGVGKFDSGDAVTPGVRGKDHTGSGLFWNADESVSISADGVEVAKFTSAFARITKLGIGMDPINIVDVEQTQNGSSKIGFVNKSTGVAALCYFGLSNSINNYLNLAMFGSGYTTTGMTRQDGAYIAGRGVGGLTINTESGSPIYFGYNNSEISQFNSAGLKMGPNIPSLGDHAATWRLTTSGAAGYDMQFLGSSNARAGITCLRARIWDSAYTSGGSPSIFITANDFSSAHWLDGTAYWIQQNSNGRNLHIVSGNNTALGVSLAPGGTSWGAISQIELKTDFEEIKNAVEIIKQHRLEKWLYKVDDPNRQKRVGPYYEDAAQFWPTAANMGNDGRGTVTIADYIPLLMKAVVEFDERLSNIETRLTALESN